MSIAAAADGEIAATRRSPWYRRRWFVWLVALVTLPMVMAGFGLVYLGTLAARAERSAVAEADRTDPGWRLTDIEAARPAVSDPENSALVVQRASSLMGPAGPYARLRAGVRSEQGAAFLYNKVYDFDPVAAMAPATAAAYADGLKPYDAALAAARELAGMRRGRYPRVHRSLNYWSRPPHFDTIRDVARLLDADATLSAHRGDGDAAILDCRAILGAAASLGDEPGLPAAEARLETLDFALHALLRTLGQGTASDASLARLDADLAAADALPLLRVALRGERAAADAQLEELSTRPLNVVGRMGPPAVRRPMARGGAPVRIWLRFARAAALSRATDAVAILDQSTHQQKALWDAHLDRATKATTGDFAGLLVHTPARQFALPGWNMPEVFYSANAKIRAARIAIALERYRLSHGRWPADAAELAMPGGFPTDPFVATPMRMKREQYGWAIYSVGANGLDQGGTFSRSKFPTVDVGLRLRDFKYRHLLPLPAP